MQLVAFSCPSAYNQPLCVAVYWFVAIQQLKFAFFSPSFAEDGGTDEDEDDDDEITEEDDIMDEMIDDESVDSREFRDDES